MGTFNRLLPFNKMWFVHIAVGLCLFFALFSTFLYIFLVPLIGYMFLLDTKTRPHGIIILVAIAYFLTNINIGMYMYGFPYLWEHNIIVGWSLFSLSFLPPGFALLFMIHSLILFPLLILEIAYWVFWSGSWKWAGVAAVSFFFFLAFGMSYRDMCSHQYNIVHSLKGQQLPKEELLQKAGEPLYERQNQNRYGYYLDGIHVVQVTFQENGICHVSEDIERWLD